MSAIKYCLPLKYSYLHQFFRFHFLAPKTISLLQKTKSIPIKLCILDSTSSEYELPDLPEESDSDLPDVTIPKQYKYCKFGQSKYQR